ncbi:MAG: bifunctional phosphopantothenoylcysteine decarboxylase/phosphopantothenate--cysteine ligase CoaBC [Beutenbergiaceae bacterium]
MRVVLGVSGGIAAYKAVLLLRLLREAGHSVRVIPTPAALEFVGLATWQALSAEPVTTSVFDGADSVDHVRIGREAEVMVVAPATADLMARAAAGMADDLLTATLLTVSCPVLFAPAMHTEMWRHPATVQNVATLRRRGMAVLEPEDGRLTGTDSGPGRLPEPQALMDAALGLLDAGPQDMTGRRVVVSAGGTREPLDPVRFLSNHSSGRQGAAVAAEARRRGARVTLVSAHLWPALIPEGVDLVEVETAAQLAAVMDSHRDADVIVMAAAVSDYRPAQPSRRKVKKSGGALTIELVENPDILATLARQSRPGQVVVGFAAETGDDAGSVLEHGRAKAQRKGADLLAVNAVGDGAGFGDVPNAVVVLDAQGAQVADIRGSKAEVARGLLDVIVARLNDRTGSGGGAEMSEPGTTLPA